MLDLIHAILCQGMPVSHLIDHLELDRNTRAFGPRLKGFTKVPEITYTYLSSLRIALFDLLVTHGTPEERKEAWRLHRQFRDQVKLLKTKFYKPGLKLKTINSMLHSYVSSII